MRRVLFLATLLGVVTAGAAHGQHTVGVSAEVVDAVRVEPLEVRLRSEGGSLRVAPAPKRRGSGLLESVQVTEQARGPRAVGAPAGTPSMGPAERPSSAVTVTRVIAVNS